MASPKTIELQRRQTEWGKTVALYHCAKCHGRGTMRKVKDGKGRKFYLCESCFQKEPTP